MSIYLDNGATSYPKAPGVGEAMLDYVNNVGANVNRSTYATASTAAMILLDTREQLCRLFNFDDPTHVIFTPGMTAGLNMLLKGYLKAGDHVIVSSMEHNAMMRPLVQLEKEGVEYLRKEWLSFAPAVGQKMEVRTPTETITGVFETISSKGELVLKTGNKQRYISVGDAFFKEDRK